MKKRPDGRLCKTITIDGKRHYFYGRSKQEINKKILAFEEESVKGRLFNDVADEWDGWHQEEVEISTTVAYRKPLREIKKRQKGEYLRSVTAKDIKAHLDELVAEDYSRKTISKYLSIYAQIFAYATERGWIDNNPAYIVSMPRTAKKAVRREPATKDEEKAVKEHIDLWLYPYFLLMTGMRKGEALAIRYGDIDREKKLIHVNKEISYEEGSAGKIKLPKTDAGIRDVPLLDELAKVLPEGKPDHYLFGNEHWMHKSAFARKWKKYTEQTGVRSTSHCFRHSYATLLYERGVDVKAAANVLGHKDETLTARLYEHFRETQLQSVFDKLNRPE